MDVRQAKEAEPKILNREWAVKQIYKFDDNGIWEAMKIVNRDLVDDDSMPKYEDFSLTRSDL